VALAAREAKSNGWCYPIAEMMFRAIVEMEKANG
jgi:hypothetical protein